VTTSIFGSVVLRSEDPRFLRGEGRYVDNLEIEGALHAVFVRSMMAHARLRGVQVEAARTMAGVVAVLTATDFDLADQPASGNIPQDHFSRSLLAPEVVRFVGEPVALVVAESRAQAEDAAEAVMVDYDPLPAVVGAEAALAEGAPLLFPERGSNVCDRFDSGTDQGDPLEGAEVVVRLRTVNQRVAPVPMEGNAFAAAPDPEGDGLTVWVSTQVPFDVRNDVAEALGMAREKVRAVAPDVGGGFGAKLQIYPEYLLIASAAMRLGRPVRWIESRAEDLVVLTHGRAQIQDVELGARGDGTLTGMRVRLLADMGAYPIGAFLPPITGEMLSGVYRIPRISCEGVTVVTNATPIAPYRGAGRPEATALVERAVDLLADELGIDPVELRRRNLIPPAAFPYRTATGVTYDTGDYERALDEALRLAGYDELREEQSARRSRGEVSLLGIGVSVYVEVTSGASNEFGAVEVAGDGTVTARSGVTPTGQGHETALAQVVSGVLEVPFDAVRVVHSDTGRVPHGEGSWGSRSLQVGGSALWLASEKVIDKARRIAAHLLETDAEDLVRTGGGGFGVAGAPERSVSWRQVAHAASDPSRLSSSLEPGLEASERFRGEDNTFPFGAHVAVVEVDAQTGEVRLVRMVAVDDCGRIVNPALVDGQVQGGLAQGIAQALFEAVEYDEQGSPMTASLATYAIPSAAELPALENAHTQTPTTLNPLGVKGVGESGTIGSAPAVQNAVVDALSHLGVRHLDMPLSPERVWRAIRARAGGAPAPPDGSPASGRSGTRSGAPS
jgi:aerobic carbon-monoxide dehydrogenase large subunit